MSARRRGDVVAVTGAAGTLGAAVVALLADDPAVRAVLAVDVAPVEAPNDRVEVRRVDVRDALLDRAFAGADVVVHVAGRHTLDAPPVERRAVNVRGTANVLDAAAVAGVGRVVLVTSAMVYGALPDNPVPLTEQSPLRAVRDDGMAGDFLEVERIVEAHRLTGSRLEVTVLRPATVVACGADSVLTRHFEAPRLLVLRGGEPLWQFCHVEDLAAACAFAARGAVTGVANVAPDGWLTQREVETVTGLRRIELPAAVALTTQERLHRLGITPAPASELAYLQHPWVVGNDRLVAAGWKPRYDHAAALSAQLARTRGRTALAARRVDRDDATRAAAGATLAVLGTAALVRRARRRRR